MSNNLRQMPSPDTSSTLDALRPSHSSQKAESEHESDAQSSSASSPVLLQPAREQAAELRGLLQQKSADPATTDAVQQTAQQGLQGSPGTLPHLDRIQQSFGQHDLSGVGAYSGTAAKEASKSLGAKAYTSADRIAFGSTPDLHTAAHEAAHVVQQRAGISIEGGVGKPNDQFESHANAVADKVVQGKSAESLLNRVHEGGAGASGGSAAIQMEPSDEALGPLTDREVRSAIGYSRARQLPADAWSKIASIVGSSSTEIGEELVQKIAAWQAAKGLDSDGKSGNVTTQWLSQQGGGAGLEAFVKSNATVYLGINPVSRKIELSRLKAVAGSKNVTGIMGARNQDSAQVEGNTVDLTTEEGLGAFAQSLDRLDVAKQDSVAQFLRSASEDSRDELAQYVQILHATESGERLMKRMILSGHSGGWSISGDTGNDTYVSFSQLKKLNPIFPNAHGQVEDLMLSACNTGQRSKLNQFQEIFPNIRSIWAYVGYSPSAATGSLKHIAAWEKASRGTIDASRMDLGREGISTQSGKRDKNVAVWTRDAGGNEAYETASPEASMDYETMRSIVDSNMEHFKTAFNDGNINQSELNSLYTHMQNLVGNFQWRLGSDFEAYDRIMKQTLYLRHWKKVSKKFVEAFGDKVRAGYGEAAMPNFAGSDRASTLAFIESYPGTPGDAAHSLLTSYLRDLNPELIPDTWY